MMMLNRGQMGSSPDRSVVSRLGRRHKRLDNNVVQQRANSVSVQQAGSSNGIPTTPGKAGNRDTDSAKS